MKMMCPEKMAGLCALTLLALLSGCGSGTTIDPCAGKTGSCTTQGELRCSTDNKKIEACQKDADNCLVWQMSEDCAAGQKTCDSSGQSPECVSQCQDLCQPLDAMRCQGNIIERCQLTGSGCLNWVLSQDCGAQGKLCDGSVSPPQCTDCLSECTSGTLRCQGNVLQQCEQVAQNCFHWKDIQDCSANGAVCQQESSPASCVTPCQDNAGCAFSDYCHKKSCDAENGFCRERPGNCGGDFSPVCGCDGQTYSNACLAAAAGMNVDYPGECSKLCHSDMECDNGEYCRLSDCSAETGTCRPKPTECSNDWTPVCGCDGLSYPNECYAARVGMNLDHRGLCDGERCFANLLCSEASFCRLVQCQAESGRCQARPQNCPMVINPVCGCDGLTYDNECYAAQAGVSVAFEGQCPKTCSTNNDCSRTEFCFLESCNNKSGVCRDRPSQCENRPDPVCGCDGKTYNNECWANQEGMNVDHPGACNAPSCHDNGECQSVTLYCYKHTCIDESGWCVQRPNGCLVPIYAPVCACDGNTYNNECEAHLAGQNIDHAGKCEGAHCLAQNDCQADTLYCVFVPCSIETGACRLQPAACEMVWQPVCGCDKFTYANDCVAAMFGASVDYQGECH